MHPVLQKFLSQFPELSPSEVEIISEHIPIVDKKKGDMILREGEVPDKCYYVLEGCVRQYCLEDGEEKTTGFYTEQYGTISSTNYIQQTPSDQYLVCMEDCTLICGDPKTDMENYEKFPILKSVTAKMVEQELNDTKDRFAKFIIASPEKRYLNFLEERPDLSNRVPQHQIASFLGMTAESLSRIRRRIQMKKA
ncbi:MAG: Crp/Fnr family transcriptional regulator [Saprospiraceae bacterium]|nr:Crp/Fnr family transcriptional regulator [Saprospiraceae bacterium]